MRSILRRSISLALGLGILLTLLVPALADSSTTQYTSAAKDLNWNTEIYAVTDKNYGAYPYYGAKWEPKAGSYYGRFCASGTRADGTYGVVNQQELSNESAVSFYTSLNDEYSLQYWSYLYGKITADGEHALLINLNFMYEATDCTRVNNGTYDASLRENLKYLGTLRCPVFIRIAGEVNVWENRPTTTAYINAFRRVAGIAREVCPNAALVYSPNYSSAYRVDMDSFYPGDSYADWVGASLYYDRYSHTGLTGQDKFLGVGAYGDALLNVQQTVNLSRLHKKPLIITENGSARVSNGRDTLAFAADKVQEAYSYLTMRYPEIKCIIYADTNFGSASHLYSIRDDATMTAAYNKGVASNPTLLHGLSGKAAYYTPLGKVTDPLKGKVTLAAYSYTGSKEEPLWYVDGSWAATAKDYPYTFVLDAEKLTPGTHTVEIRFGGENKRSYTIRTEKLALTAVPRQEPTCTTAGCIAHWIDSRGNRFADQAGTRPLTQGDTVIPAKGHDWGDWTETAPAACATQGTQTRTCRTDPSHTETRKTPALGHDWGDWIVTQEPTDFTAGSRYHICNRDQAHTETEKIPALGNPFEDVPAGAYYETPVCWAVANKITAGTSATKFSPKADCTRGQIVTFLWRLAGSPEPETADCPFTDVEEGAYYYRAVLWAVENRITAGTTQTTFSPGQSCTRGQVVTFLYRYAKAAPPEEAENPFTDVDPGAYYYSPVLWAVEHGVTAGTSETTFSPGKSCTRGQIVTFLYRFAREG